MIREIKQARNFDTERFWARLPNVIQSIPEQDHLAFFMKMMEEMDKLGFNFSEHGDCIIDAISIRVQSGEW